MPASILLHGLGIFVLFSLRFPPPRLETVPPVSRLTLILPGVGDVPRPAPMTRVPARPFRPLPPPPRQVPRLAAELPAAPVLEMPRPSLPEVDLPPTIPPPPLKTDNLAEAHFVATAPPSKVAVRAAGFGSIDTPTQRPPRGTLPASGAFDSVRSAERAPVQRSHVEVASAGFGDTVVAAPTPAISQPAALPVLKPVEIVSKPRPAYTDEARHLQIEGEVLVEVVFSASGEARVVRVLRGLGHGLDESAIAAARDIRFHPAQRGGAAVDSSAVVHIVFQLAY
jgi:TonB family protein